MREILFRGKRIDNGEWLVSDCIMQFEKHPIKKCRVVQLWVNDEGWVDVIPETVGEYIGFPDKNGKNTFEGDIVAVEGFIERAFIIIYYNGGFKLKEIGSEDLFAYYITETMVEEELIEVIGNIHDNPELLEGEG